jgi:hypothetical protein
MHKLSLGIYKKARLATRNRYSDMLNFLVPLTTSIMVNIEDEKWQKKSLIEDQA